MADIDPNGPCNDGLDDEDLVGPGWGSRLVDMADPMCQAAAFTPPECSAPTGRNETVDCDELGLEQCANLYDPDGSNPGPLNLFVGFSCRSTRVHYLSRSPRVRRATVGNSGGVGGSTSPLRFPGW